MIIERSTKFEAFMISFIMLIITLFKRRCNYSKLSGNKEMNERRRNRFFNICREICIFKIDFDPINIYGREWPD